MTSYNHDVINDRNPP